jgi:phenylalanyl-tRNA synthetase alpha chain
MDLRTRIEEARSRLLSELTSASSKDLLAQVRNRYLTGKESVLRGLFALLSKVPADKKGEEGKTLNSFKTWVESEIDKVQAKLGAGAGPAVDPTLPGKLAPLGRRHPIYKTWEDIVEIFARLGFDVAYGPEIEHERNNFEKLNIPLDHPSRDAFDTFYLERPWLLRSHTSPVQIRTMLREKPPIRIVAPGKVFRPDKADSSHLPSFHQVEGLMIGEGVTFAHLKGMLLLFAESMFGAGTKVRFRPSFFPFTEPSAEVDISCILCGAKGCPACKGSGWMEILGSGMVHPKVLQDCGIDPEKYTGFAFGMGVERICMLRHGVTDIRYFLENHFRFLEQF